MSHNLYYKHASMGICSSMNAVNNIGCYIHSALETESHISSPKVVIYGLWKSDNIETFSPETVCSLVCAVSAKYHKTVKVKLMISVLHALYFVISFFIRLVYCLKRHPG